VPVADLKVVKINNYEIAHKKAHKGDTVIWTIKVTNDGPDEAINAVARDLLPSGVTYLSDDSNGKYNPNTGIWKIGNLAKGQSVVLRITTKITGSNKNITNPVVVKSDSYDPNRRNNYDNSTVTSIAIADLELTKVANASEVRVDDSVSFLITVINHGPDTAVNARVYDPMPEGLNVTGYKLSKGVYDPETGIWLIGDLKRGEKAYLEIDTVALKTGEIINKAYVKSDTYDNDTSNNFDFAVVTVIEDTTPPGIKLYPTGNPIILVLLSLVTVVGITLRRKS
jgi:uncharacterized repeat protein (TIGR01451 family)